VDERLRAQVARVQSALRPAMSGVKWVEPELCHLTLKFLGYVPEAKLPDIIGVSQRAVQGQEPFELAFRGVGGFPRLRNARVLWMGLEKGEAPLKALQASLERELQPLGFVPESRGFSSHLTLGRFRARAPSSLEELVTPFVRQRFGTVHVDELRLMRSILRPSGPDYSVIQAFPLG
jgi:RNA 2',3'-cyclic 3'-phosphodiesterase